MSVDVFSSMFDCAFEGFPLHFLFGYKQAVRRKLGNIPFLHLLLMLILMVVLMPMRPVLPDGSDEVHGCRVKRDWEGGRGRWLFVM